MRTLPRLLLLALTVLLLVLAAPLLAQQPSIETTTFWSRTLWYPSSDSSDTGGGFHLDGYWGAFLPEDVYYDGSQASNHDRLKAVLSDSSGAELWRQRLIAERRYAVFSWVRPVDTVPQYWFKQGGDYTLSFTLDDQPIARLPFTVTLERGGDPFDPQLTTRFDGPWSEWGVWQLPELGDLDALPKFVFWTIGGSHNASGGDEKQQLKVVHDGDVIFTSRTQHVASLESHSVWKRTEIVPNFPDAEGGGPIRTRDLLKLDGTYHVVLEREGRLRAAFPFEVQGGKLVAHPRQALDYQPHPDALLMRLPGQGMPDSADLFWAPRLHGEEAAAALAANTRVIAGPSDADRARWTVAASGGAQPLQVVTTEVRARMDAGLAVGDGVVAYGTGGYKGAAWMKVGEDVSRSLPGGADYLASTLFVCGRKVVAVKDRQVVVFDTDTETLHELPADVITLAATPRGRYEATPIHADGHLVVTANDPKKVQDRTVIKVLDLSGAEPVVIALDNADFSGSEVTSVAVDAEGGQLAVSVDKRNAIYVGDVAPGAKLRGFDVSGHDGLGRYGLAIDRGLVIWRDKPSTGQLRAFSAASGGVQVLGGIDGPGTRFALCDGLAAWPSPETSGSDRLYTLARPGDAYVRPAAAGEGLSGVQGKLGFGQSVALVPGGGVFVAGAGKSGIGTGEYLMATTGQAWQLVGAAADGKPLSAVDVTAGAGLVVFKTGSRNDTVIGYATFGSRLTLP